MKIAIFVIALVVVLAVFLLATPRPTLKAPRPTFTLYYLPTCGWCKKMMPEWDAFEASYRGPVTLQRVDASKESERAQRAGVRAFPTIIYESGSVVRTYEGERTASAFAAFLDQF